MEPQADQTARLIGRYLLFFSTLSIAQNYGILESGSGNIFGVPINFEKLAQFLYPAVLFLSFGHILAVGYTVQCMKKSGVIVLPWKMKNTEDDVDFAVLKFAVLVAMPFAPIAVAIFAILAPIKN